MSTRRDVDSDWAWLTVGLGFTMYSLLVLYWEHKQGSRVKPVSLHRRGVDVGKAAMSVLLAETWPGPDWMGTCCCKTKTRNCKKIWGPKV